MFQAEKQKAKVVGCKVTAGTLQNIMIQEAEKANVYIKSISRETVLSWIKRGNPEGFNEQQVSPVHELEHIISEFCIRLATMGHPPTRETVR
jgi:hypothetical protein